jgi:hypothetical protein
MPYNWFAGASWQLPAMTRGTSKAIENEYDAKSVC